MNKEDFSNIKRQFKLIAICILGGVLTFFIAFILTYIIVCYIDPPIIVDRNGEEHPSQPFEQIFIALILAILTAILSMVVTHRRLTK